VTRARSLRAGLATVVGTLLSTTVASACPVCFQAQNDENRIAFIATTVFLSLLPFALVGGLVVWVRRKARQVAAEEAALAAPSPNLGAAGASTSGHAPART